MVATGSQAAYNINKKRTNFLKQRRQARKNEKKVRANNIYQKPLLVSKKLSKKALRKIEKRKRHQAKYENDKLLKSSKLSKRDIKNYMNEKTKKGQLNNEKTINEIYNNDNDDAMTE